MRAAIAAPQLAYPGPRPKGSREGMGNGRGEWDWFYALPSREQNRLRFHMSHRGSQPDEWAAAMGYDDTEDAMRYWQGLVAESRDDEWAEPEEQGPEYLGPAEAAEFLKVQRATIRTWRARGLLPEPAMTFAAGSGKGALLPVWRVEDIRAFGVDRALL